ncbi:MAG: DHH family phosphoesterase, partial [Clostridiales bacterium]|nr:DHH family phosphoesterase [Clostridiales bacterium]
MKFQSWKLSQPDGALAARFQRIGVSPLAALVLAGRGYETEEEVRQFLRRDEGLLHDPMLMRGMSGAVARIRQGLARKEKICVYGDYDVDGITSTCLLTAYLRSEGGQVLPYVPNRLKEGYSLNKAALEGLKAQGVSLIVTVDCGITNLNEAAYAAQLGMDLVITDHHECLPRLPRCCAVVNPHQPMCPYPNKELAGVGVALKLVLALGGRERQQDLFRAYADLAAIGTVADVM